VVTSPSTGADTAWTTETGGGLNAGGGEDVGVGEAVEVGEDVGVGVGEGEGLGSGSGTPRVMVARVVPAVTDWPCCTGIEVTSPPAEALMVWSSSRTTMPLRGTTRLTEPTFASTTRCADGEGAVADEASLRFCGRTAAAPTATSRPTRSTPNSAHPVPVRGGNRRGGRGGGAGAQAGWRPDRLRERNRRTFEKRAISDSSAIGIACLGRELGLPDVRQY